YARTGVAYFVGDYLQSDISGLINFTNTPSRWQVAAGISYRFDMHKQDEFLGDSNEGDLRKGRSKKRKIETKPELEN
ncbi:MAG: transporter, partial [Flavobacteriaceae bacterium]|nr:transporter [Flavobacteriaceae bacterium]